MPIEKKQSYQAYRQEQMKNEPDYSLVGLAHLWGGEIIRDMRLNGSPPGTVESEAIYEKCSSIIFAGIESGNLEATFPEKHISHTPRYNRETGQSITEEIKAAPFWIIETSKYIVWARANGAGPRELVDDFIEEIGTDGESINSPVEDDKPLDERERQTYLLIIAALCKMHRISPCERGLAGKLSKLTELLGTKRGEGAIKDKLDKAGLFFN